MLTSKLTSKLTSVFSEIVSVDAEIISRYSCNLDAPLHQESNSAFYNT